MSAKVYCLFYGSYDERALDSVHATLELAQAAAEIEGAEDHHEWVAKDGYEPDRRYWHCAFDRFSSGRGCEWSIEEHLLRAAAPLAIVCGYRTTNRFISAHSL